MIAPICEQVSADHPVGDRDERWETAYKQFLMLVAAELRDEVDRIVTRMHGSGEGIRLWVSAIAYRGAVMPSCIPKELLRVYLSDPEALPLHDCGNCGLSVPVRPNHRYGIEGDPEEEYFPVCPACGGRTGLYNFWSNRIDKGSRQMANGF